VAEKEEDLCTASNGKCKHDEEQERANNGTHHSINNPWHHHAPIALQNARCVQ